MATVNKIKLDYINVFGYLISPFLSILPIIYSIYRQTKLSPFFYSLLVGFISFLYKPTIEMDKARHIDSYEYAKYLSIEGFFISNFEGTPDFLFHLILYLGAIYNISVHFIFFLMTFITIYLIFKVYIKVIRNDEVYSSYMHIIVPLLIFSLSYIDIIVGIRFTLASSFTFYGYYLGLLEKKKYSFAWIVLGALVHFGVILFLVIYLLYPLLKKINGKRLQLLLLFSILFYFISQEMIYGFFKFLGLGGAFDTKIDSYMNTGDFINEASGFSQKIIDFFNIVWVYVLSLFLIFKNENHSEHRGILIWLLIFTNIFISFPVVYNRYMLFVKLVAVLYLLNDEIKLGKTKMSKIFVTLFAVICLNQMIVMRNGLIELFSNIHYWSFISSVISNNFTSNDIN